MSTATSTELIHRALQASLTRFQHSPRVHAAMQTRWKRFVNKKYVAICFLD